MARFIVQAVVTALGVWLAFIVVPGVDFTGEWSLIWAAVLLGIVNAIVRPVLVVLTFPLTLVTFGLFLLVVNAATIGLTAVFLDGFVTDRNRRLVVGGLEAHIGERPLLTSQAPTGRRLRRGDKAAAKHALAHLINGQTVAQLRFEALRGHALAS